MKWLGFILTASVLALGVFLISLSFYLDNNQKYLKEVAAKTEGVIVFGGTSKDSSSKIQYEIGGKEYTIHASIGRRNEGGICSVYYDPKDPENATVNLDYYDTTRLILLILGGIMFSYVGIYGMYKSFMIIKSENNDA